MNMPQKELEIQVGEYEMEESSRLAYLQGASIVLGPVDMELASSLRMLNLLCTHFDLNSKQHSEGSF